MSEPPADDLIALDKQARELLFTEARTANTFTDEPVTDAQLRAIFELTKWPPTSANTQPLRVLYVSQGEARERLVAHMQGSNQEKTRRAPVVAVLAADQEFHRHSILVVNIGHPGENAWHDRLPRLDYDQAVRHI